MFEERTTRDPMQFWQQQGGLSPTVFVVTTNGVVDSRGNAVMGGGIARQAKELYPTLPQELGKLLRTEGNQCYVFNTQDRTIITMPTKEHFKDPSPIELVLESARRVAELAMAYKWQHINAPRPGCGLGGLQWEEVREELKEIWNERFTVWHVVA